MDHQISMYILAVLCVLGGIELIRFSWPDLKHEQDWGANSYERQAIEFQPAHLGVTFGAILVILGCVAGYGGYCGWTMMQVLTTVKDLAQEYVI